ncbi:hypothetical protein QYE76_026428 [Lolium multiflorum]|uniref:DDE Tnp4 domain-containing protein n=1 Tax=Lolium multiflorum TaxID=4521 RepID=A0AAD8RHM9_LOLMU|nr:hypothetical protein QYE76_026428 [Lolium multiflorum]
MGCSVGKRRRRRRPKREIARWKSSSTILQFSAIRAILQRSEPAKGTCCLLPRNLPQGIVGPGVVHAIHIAFILGIETDGGNKGARGVPLHRLSTKTISRYLQQVLYAIGELRDEMIKPASMNTPTKIKNSYRWFPYFRDCVGAIDGTHVTAKVSRSMSPAFRGRKHYTSQNMLAAVDFDMSFTYVLAGWEGSAHDASILADSFSRPDGLQIPEGWSEDGFFEEVVTFDEVETGHGMEACDNDAWKVKRQEWADRMWEARGNTTI